MYDWRKMTGQQRKETLAIRKRARTPMHSLPHLDSGPNQYMVTATCFEHKPHIGFTPERMAEFERDLLELLHNHAEETYCWCVLPYHYHTLVFSMAIKPLLRELGKLHGGTSYKWNGEEVARGRKVWFQAAETVMKSENHFWTTFNYIHNNPVKHGYVEKWQDWPFSSAAMWLDKLGRNRMLEIWEGYPPLDYGDDWDV